MDDEQEYDVFDFDDVCSVDFITYVATTCDTSTIQLNPKLLSESLKYAFLGYDESLPMTIASNLDQD